jgi:hypothetical protein
MHFMGRWVLASGDPCFFRAARRPRNLLNERESPDLHLAKVALPMGLG